LSTLEKYFPKILLLLKASDKRGYLFRDTPISLPFLSLERLPRVSRIGGAIAASSADSMRVRVVLMHPPLQIALLKAATY
jgi:hypothetical protein